MIEADPESMRAKETAHKLGTNADSSVDSGSASDFKPYRFITSGNFSGIPTCRRPPGMTGLGAFGKNNDVKDNETVF